DYYCAIWHSNAWVF
nr:immunoglobulin light chain junction region [Macaca mulatta]MOY04921.1 immunoglobulin light chain junction region [Macaca mulatta]MOY08436.1 immunoglobulin light chain junction region [Macaca mulatta]MOY08568.1 immunoglobulin light chain junction region [Macaca mulatta]